MKISKDALLIVLVFIAVFLGMRFLAGRPAPTENMVSSSLNADPRGTKAIYTLLGDKLGYNVARLTVPFDRMPAKADVLVVVEPLPAAGALLPGMEQEAVGEQEAAALADWVKKGGILILASGDLGQFPTELTRSGKLGKGRIYAYSSISALSNKGMRDGGRAVRIVNIIARHASRKDLVLFDEYHHGYGGQSSVLALIGPRVKISVLFFAAALLVGVVSQSRRFGAVRSLSEEETLRPGREFVEAVGRLYRRAGATDVASEIMLESFERKLRLKLGVSAESTPSEISSRISAASNAQIAERVTRVLAARGKASAGQKPSEQELLHITIEVQQLEKELGLERIHS